MVKTLERSNVSMITQNHGKKGTKVETVSSSPMQNKLEDIQRAFREDFSSSSSREVVLDSGQGRANEKNKDRSSSIFLVCMFVVKGTS